MAYKYTLGLPRVRVQNMVQYHIIQFCVPRHFSFDDVKFSDRMKEKSKS